MQKRKRGAPVRKGRAPENLSARGAAMPPRGRSLFLVYIRCLFARKQAAQTKQSTNSSATPARMTAAPQPGSCTPKKSMCTENSPERASAKGLPRDALHLPQRPLHQKAAKEPRGVAPGHKESDVLHPLGEGTDGDIRADQEARHRADDDVDAVNAPSECRKPIKKTSIVEEAATDKSAVPIAPKTSAAVRNQLPERAR